jgi:hypothetical protein
LSNLVPARQTLWPLRVSRERAPLLLLQAMLTTFPDDVERFRSLCTRVTRWDRFFDLAERHGVGGLLHRALRQSDYRLPAEDAAAIDRRAAAGRLVQRHLQQGMSEVLAAFVKAGLRAVVLKGPILAERVYGDATLRYSSDLDILIGLDELESGSELLKSLGYRIRGGPAGRYERTHMQNLTFYHAELPMVELHFHLLVEFGVSVRAEDCLKRARLYQAQDGTTCHVLSVEDEVFYLCLHAVHHEFERFCWLYDIWMLLRRTSALDWDLIFQRAERLGVRQALSYTVELLRRRLGLTSRGSYHRDLVLSPRRELASLLLRVYAAVSVYPLWNGLSSILFKAAICDRTEESLSFLGHQVARNTRRRLWRYSPRCAPVEWSA